MEDSDKSAVCALLLSANVLKWAVGVDSGSCDAVLYEEYNEISYEVISDKFISYYGNFARQDII